AARLLLDAGRDGHPARRDPVLPGARRPAADPGVGKDGERRALVSHGGAPRLALPRPRDLRRRDGLQLSRRRPPRRARPEDGARRDRIAVAPRIPLPGPSLDLEISASLAEISR